MTAHHPGIPRDAGHPIRYRIHNVLSALVNWAGERMLRGTPYRTGGRWS